MDDPQIPLLNIQGVNIALTFGGPLGVIDANLLAVPGSPGMYPIAVLLTNGDGLAYWGSITPPLFINGGGALELPLAEGLGVVDGAALGLAPRQWNRLATFGGTLAPFTMTRTGDATIAVATAGIADANHPMPMEFTTGTGATNLARLSIGATDGLFLSNLLRQRLTADIHLPVLSDAAQRYATAFGWSDLLTGVGGTNNSLILSYADNVNGGKFKLEAKKAGAVTTVDTGVAAVAATWHTVEIVVDGNGIHAVIDGTASAAIAWAKLPVVGLGFLFGMFKSVGTTARLMRASPVCLDIETNR